MTFTVHCPKCSMGLTASQADIGKQGKCSGCGTVFSIEMPYATSAPAAPPSVVPALGPDYPLGVIRAGEGISRGFAMLHGNLGVFLLIALCLVGIGLGITIAGQVPCLGVLIALGNAFFLQPALECGFYRACLKQLDGDSAEVGDLFREFNAWVDYLLFILIQLVIGCGVFVPAGIVGFIGLIPLMQNQPRPNIPVLIAAGAILLLSWLAMAMALMFGFVALVDRRRGFWDAIQTSWRLATSNLLGAIGAMLVMFLIAILPGLMMGGAIAGFIIMLLQSQVQPALVVLCIVFFILGLVFSLYGSPAGHCIIAGIYRTATPPRSWAQAPPTVPSWGGPPMGPPPSITGMAPPPAGGV